MTGGGFGGSAIALVDVGSIDAVVAASVADAFDDGRLPAAGVPRRRGVRPGVAHLLTRSAARRPPAPPRPVGSGRLGVTRACSRYRGGSDRPRLVTECASTADGLD